MYLTVLAFCSQKNIICKVLDIDRTKSRIMNMKKNYGDLKLLLVKKKADLHQKEKQLEGLKSDLEILRQEIKNLEKQIKGK